MADLSKEDIFDKQISDSDDSQPADEYEVEEIKADEYCPKRKKRVYLVGWKGYKPEFDTWEPEDNLTHCTEKLKEYKEAKKKKLSKKQDAGFIVDSEEATSSSRASSSQQLTGKRGKKQPAKRITPRQSKVECKEEEDSDDEGTSKPSKKRITTGISKGRGKKRPRDQEEEEEEEADEDKATSSKPKKPRTTRAAATRSKQSAKAAAPSARLMPKPKRLVLSSSSSEDGEAGKLKGGEEKQPKEEEEVKKEKSPAVSEDSSLDELKRDLSTPATVAMDEGGRVEGGKEKEGGEKEKEVPIEEGEEEVAPMPEPDVVEDTGPEEGDVEAHQPEEGEEEGIQQGGEGQMAEGQETMEEVAQPEVDGEEEQAHNDELLQEDVPEGQGHPKEAEAVDKPVVEDVTDGQKEGPNTTSGPFPVIQEEEDQNGKEDSGGTKQKPEEKPGEEQGQRLPILRLKRPRLAKLMVAKSSSSSRSASEQPTTSAAAAVKRRGKSVSKAASKEKTPAKLSDYCVGENWWKGLKKRLMSKKELNRLEKQSKEEQDSAAYQPTEPIDKDGHLIRVREFTEGQKNGFDRGWKVESILACAPGEMCIVKFVGFKMPQKLPRSLVWDKAEKEFLKYRDWATCKMCVEKRGAYWDELLTKPESWMTPEAIRAFENWREQKLKLK